MNKKLNSIIAIIISIIIISIMLFLSISKEKTQADIINEQLKKQNGSWVATNYSKEIMKIPITQRIDEIDSYSNANPDPSPIFNTENKNNFFPENYKYDDLNSMKKEKNRNTGLFLLTDATISAPIYEFEDQINWATYMTLGKNQTTCGSCNTFAILGALEGYINRKDNLSENNKLNLSEQYLISYSNFIGCRGAGLDYYIKFLSLASYNQNSDFNNYLKNKIKGELGLENKLIAGTEHLQTRTQLSLAAGEVPFGVPLENQLNYLAYDSCEIVNLNRTTKKTTTNMNITPLLITGQGRLNINNINSNFCPDTSDSDTENSIYLPRKNDNYTKYFIESHFRIDNSDCRTINKTQTINNIKEALKLSPLATSIYFYPSLYNFESGIWSKISDEDPPTLAHGVTIVGWGTDKIRNKEYWILKNNWGEHWGNNGYFRIWIKDEDAKLECSIIYGFSGELISKSGKEINDLLPIAKQELERQNQAEIQRQENERIRQENLQRRIENMPQPITPVPDYPNDIDPLNEYNIININYQDTKYISDTDCLTIMSCMSNKLNGFYGNNNSENEFT
jgi:C1A family cysteine protease